MIHQETNGETVRVQFFQYDGGSFKIGAVMINCSRIRCDVIEIPLTFQLLLLFVSSREEESRLGKMRPF